MKAIASSFPKYEDYSPMVPIVRVSLGDAPASHRFYDSSPVSPSGRYVAYTEFPFEDRLPAPGDAAYVVVVDLFEGTETYRCATTAWDSQLGAQVQWGADDQSLLFNKMDESTWTPFGVCVDPLTGNERHLEGTVYHVSPDGHFALSPSLTQIWLVQPGYGVIVPQENLAEATGFSSTDGLFKTDIASGKSKLLVSFADIVSALPKEFGHLDPQTGGFYGFHPKWSPDGKKIMFIVRWRDHAMRIGQSKNWILTMDAQGQNLKVAMTAKRWVGGHHPNWCPDSTHIVMNLAFRNSKVPFPKLMRLTERVLRKLKVHWNSGAFHLRLAKFAYDGTGLEIVAPSHFGSGHPTFHDGLNAILTDAYPNEIVTAGDGTVPIRLVSIDTDTSETIIRLKTQPSFSGSRQEWRVDPHPAWDRTMSKLVFNGYVNGVRQVFYADLSAMIAAKTSQTKVTQ